MTTPGPYGPPQVPPLNSPAGAVTPIGVTPGISNGVVIANIVIVFGPSGGIFVYSGTPALGNLIGSVAGVPGTDHYGNSYRAGFTAYYNGVTPDLLDVSMYADGLLFFYQNGQNPGFLVNSTGADALGNVVGGLSLGTGIVNAGDDPAVITLSSGSAADGTPAQILISSQNAASTTMLDAVQVTGAANIGTYATSTSFLAYGAAASKQVVTFANAGTFTWKAPAGVTSVKAECLGGGAGGGGGNTNGAGGGGGGSEYAAATGIAVTPGNSYSLTVGASGAGGSGSSGGGGTSGAGGGNSSFAGNSVTVTAHGGSGGASSAAGGAGGAGGTGSAAATHFNGGSGGNGGVVAGGGGGGSSAGTGSAGNNGGNGPSGTPGTAVSGGGPGGQGGSITGNGNGSIPNTPPGGGGGGGIGTGNGAAGRAGQVRLTYTPASSPLVSAVVGNALTDPVDSIALTPGIYNGLTAWLLPSGDTTGAGDTANISGAQSAGYTDIRLAPGNWYLDATVTVAAHATFSGSGDLTIIQQGSNSFTGTGLFSPGSNSRITAMTATLKSIAFIDFANANITGLELDHITWTCTPASAGTGGAWLTGLNLHQADIHDCTLTQNDPGTEIVTIGSTGSGFSETTVTRVRSFLACTPGVAPTGTRTTSGWKLYASGNKNVDTIRFGQCYFANSSTSGCFNTSQYIVDIACTANAANNDFDRISFVQCDFGSPFGGMARVQSTAGIVFEHVTCGNVVSGSLTAQADLISIGTNGASGQHSAAVSIRDYQREGGGVPHGAGNPSDIGISADTVNVTIDNPSVPDSAVQPQINLNGAAGVLVINVSATASILNQNNTAAQKTIVIGNGAITVGGTAITVP